MTSLPSSIHVLSHPLLTHHLANLRLKDTPSKEFRSLIHAISTVLIVEASKELQTTPVQGQGPLSDFQGQQMKERIGVVPILRAGLGMVDASLSLLPDNTSVLHIGLYREKVSLQAVEYYSKLPSSPTVDRVFILDPLIATGGTAVACVKMMTDWGIGSDRVTLVCVLASRQGLENLEKACPGLQVWVGAVDETLNEKGLIIPGLGDAGDRLFDTL